MGYLEGLGDKFNISIPADADGLIGRECPVSGCESYFKVQFGTGLKGENLPCHCPYCGHSDSQDKFLTKAQAEYIKSVVLNKFTDAMLKDFKSLEFNHRPKGSFGIGISLRVDGHPYPIQYYREKQLETEVVCDKCTLRYMIYGVFGFCPDCGIHNSPQILKKNLDLVDKMVMFAGTQEPSVSQMLIANALEDCISGFDGFGRETCRVFSHKAIDITKATGISFQAIDRGRDRIKELFGVDFAQGITKQEWAFILRCFQKRHLLAHNMGVVDQEYIDKTHDASAVIGRKTQIQPAEVQALTKILRIVSEQLFDSFNSKA